MIGKKNNRVLLSPLDWGLGHTTRCIPIIRYLQQSGFEVVIAAETGSAQLLAAEFPGIEIKQLTGYRIRYNKQLPLSISLPKQLPRIFQTIRAEHEWLKDLLKKEQFRFIISDNRPGFYNQTVRSVYITHQLLIKSGKGRFIDRLLQNIHAHYMKRFDEVWVPDMQGKQNLAGDLSHPQVHFVQPAYIGLLSRFERISETTEKNDLLILLSGPEPQRSVLEQKMMEQLNEYHGSVLLVRGLPADGQTVLPVKENITVANHLPAHLLQAAIASSRQIICRSGYTTLMDLVKMKKKALLIPTPGQPEQEYLAAYMQQQQLFPYELQKNFNLKTALEKLEKFTPAFSFNENEFEIFKAVVDKTEKANNAG